MMRNQFCYISSLALETVYIKGLTDFHPWTINNVVCSRLFHCFNALTFTLVSVAQSLYEHVVLTCRQVISLPSQFWVSTFPVCLSLCVKIKKVITEKTYEINIIKSNLFLKKWKKRHMMLELCFESALICKVIKHHVDFRHVYLMI